MMVHSRLSELFAENFTTLGELGASVCAWHDGQEIVSLAGGYKDRQHEQAWDENTMVLFWSATKGLAAACLLHACQEHHIAPATPVAEVWPEFAQAGKERVTIAQMLSHQAGLAALATPAPVMDHEAVVAALGRLRARVAARRRARLSSAHVWLPRG
ncbi:Beta-lactamase class C and other penicillin binding protein-like protein [Chthoniobacter flavus Ellin428]|uniref:Beta-lactamase class C and other penicillin binding protein-like protein n=1 Tax=Chthoniobacter flavus Ellin428 TaxID=497964 RepID=B4D4G2_9BACT|nr:hydrolase [Chthoniobacter flavus]EDY18763.1 Beta-lactamase class C and other penicillin binding protein-like protein [Chthoniobacter flavus Ellin428]